MIRFRRRTIRFRYSLAAWVVLPIWRAAMMSVSSLWSSFSSYAAWHVEGGKGTKQKAVKFQVRPDPLSK
jgi:hypothetical protein